MDSQTEVTRADQQLINRFARLNARQEELEADLKAKRGRLENASDAINELVLQDDHVLLHCGDVFARMTVEEANQWCERLRLDLESSAAKIEAELGSVRSEMSSIKTSLYAKFGNNINLEYDDDWWPLTTTKMTTDAPIYLMYLLLVNKAESFQIPSLYRSGRVFGPYASHASVRVLRKSALRGADPVLLPLELRYPTDS